MSARRMLAACLAAVLLASPAMPAHRCVTRTITRADGITHTVVRCHRVRDRHRVV